LTEQDENRARARRRPDKYDFIGMALLAFVLALVIAHFVVPDTLPPEP
jgi:hypothetical protein